MTIRRVCGLDLKQVEAIVRFWQHKLRLCDWDVSCELVDPRAEADSMASNEYEADLLRAKIKIATDHTSIESLVDSICHELIHLLLPFPEPGSAEMMITEQAIVRIAPVLAELCLSGLLPGFRRFMKRSGESCRSSGRRKTASRRRSGSSTSTSRK